MNGRPPIGRPRWKATGSLTIALLIALMAAARHSRADVAGGLWLRSLQAFEAQDKKAAPDRGGVLFLGSSSIRGWQTKTFFPGLTSLNRGLDGSHIADIDRFADRMVFPYDPKVIVFYAGDNDISAGLAPEKVLSDYQAFVQHIEEHLPLVRIVFISIKPSLLRRSMWEKMRIANRLVQAFCESDSQLAYADVATPMLGPDGKPRAELFVKDGLHLNDAGYRLWTSVVSPIVARALEPVVGPAPSAAANN